MLATRCGVRTQQIAVAVSPVSVFRRNIMESINVRDFSDEQLWHLLLVLVVEFGKRHGFRPASGSLGDPCRDIYDKI